MRDVIVDGRLWLSSPSDLNDPFEMAARYIAEAPLKQKRERIAELVKANAIGVPWKKRQQIVTQWMLKTNGELARVAQNSQPASARSDQRNTLIGRSKRYEKGPYHAFRDTFFASKRAL